MLTRLYRRTIENRPLPREDPANDSTHLNDENLGRYWNKFCELRLQEGYLIPGHWSSLHPYTRTWVNKWPDEGIRSSTIFAQLQYCMPRDKLRALNELTPLELHPENSYTEVTAYLTDHSQFVLASRDVESITLLHPGRYPVREARERGAATYDLVVSETRLNEPILHAIHVGNQAINRFNKWQERPSEERGLMRRMSFMKNDTERFSLIDPMKGQGRLTQNIAKLNEVHLAKAYTLEGKKVRGSTSRR